MAPPCLQPTTGLLAALAAAEDCANSYTPTVGIQQSAGTPSCCGTTVAPGPALPPLPHVALRQGKPPSCSLAHVSSSESITPHTPAGDEGSAAGLARAASDLGDASPAGEASSRASSGSFAFVTLLTRDTYLPGVQALARSLAAVQAAHPLLVMYTADTLSCSAVAALQQEPGCQPLAVQRYSPPGRHDMGRYKLQLYAECWTKLRMWELEQWGRLVYLDADMLVVRNIDCLFGLPPGFYAAPDCAAGRETQQERDACSLFCPQQPAYFNAGMFVMSPSRAELARFGSLLEAGAAPIGGYAEQDFLNWRYQGVWRPLPPAFNAQRGIRWHHPRLWDELWAEVSIIHYTDAKPWQAGHPDYERDADLAELWWRAYKGAASQAAASAVTGTAAVAAAAAGAAPAEPCHGHGAAEQCCYVRACVVRSVGRGYTASAAGAAGHCTVGSQQQLDCPCRAA